ncbi:hypothetical protein HG536_0H03610 [Torulaspora globosa]|uniref:PLD phosphodiesterase domain-containing protein n=1 Tax=Torulaspora globosa TaxID=48254 RepID=A0A7G3ZN99_9SACH|nr:uncharacterized protein HG536_0H03610 [Torulaspora globosa]QLL34985.1 hypothetical protein HG536_0H03610 [Torulaspora globosa]
MPQIVSVPSSQESQVKGCLKTNVVLGEIGRLEMEISECRRAVAERWSKVEYRQTQIKSDTAECNDDSAVSTDVEGYSDERVLKKVKREVIDLTASDEEIETPISSDFKLVRSEVLDSNVASSHFISFDQIFGDKTLKKSILFSYQYELDFLLARFHGKVEEIILVAQTGTIRPSSAPAAIALTDRLSIIEFNMPQFTCHHSKMVINFYDDGSCRIFMPSNNFTYAEANYPQQVCWCSPRLERARDAYVRGFSAFQDSLLDYLGTYKLRKISERVVSSIKTVDFSPLQDVTFVFSSPSNEIASGLQSLAKIISGGARDEAGGRAYHYLCQSSTIGAAVSKKTHANLFTHVFIPILHGIISPKSKLLSTEALLNEFKVRHIVPHLVYPTVEEIRTSPLGWLCSGWFHFNYNRDMAHYNMLSKQFSVFRKQDSRRVSQNRRTTPSHSKFYMKFTTELEAELGTSMGLDWCLYTSSNLSRTAWGTGTARPRNYEVGVLLKAGARELICRSFTDVTYRDSSNFKLKPNSQLVLVPFTLPVIPYDAKQADEAFCMSKDYDLNDIDGMPYPHN